MSDGKKVKQIFNYCDPQVKAGQTVTISVNQTLRSQPDQQDQILFDAPWADAPEAPGQVKVSIEGPRVAIDTSVIMGMYPTPGSEETSDRELPHIALGRRTLPWERPGPANGGPHSPWVALLLVKASEMEAPGQPTGGWIRRIAINALKEEDPATYGQLTTVGNFAGTTEITAVFIPNRVLAAIKPKAEELQYLVHVKREGAQDRTIVMCNRLPDAGQAQSDAEEHTALLVSLEGRSDLMEPDRPADPLKSTALILLHHWTFKPSGDGDFEQLMKSIRLWPNGGVLRFGNLPQSTQTGHLSGEFTSILDQDGYVEDFRHEQAGKVWYHGPLLPFPAHPRERLIAVKAAPEELEGAGEQDYSSAAAFELGRMLALSDAQITLEGVGPSGVGVIPPQWVDARPPVLQLPDWVVDETWQEDPWEMGGESIFKTELEHITAYGRGNLTGIEVNAPAWKSQVVTGLQTVNRVTEAVPQYLDIMTVESAELEKAFAETAVAGKM